MSKTETYSLRQVLRYAYQLRASMGPVNQSTLPQAMVLANEGEIIASGGEVKIPDWRREQLEEGLKKRYPEGIYYAVERGVLPVLKNWAIGRERVLG